MPIYPYIADRNLYLAVRFACDLIRENGWFNKAVEAASEEYGVDEEELKKAIRARQAAGQRAKAKEKPKKFKWFTCYIEVLTESDFSFHSPQVRRGLSEKSVSKLIRSDYSSSGNYFTETFLRPIKEYSTKQEAEKNLQADWAQFQKEYNPYHFDR